MLDFTIGLTEGVAWPWPIAVYLFLAGISGGAVAVAICVNLFRGVHLNTPIMKAATLIGFITIVLGMICLVLDLTNPLFFWRILVYYNPTSVMSIGVMALLFYIPLVFVLMCVALQQARIVALFERSNGSGRATPIALACASCCNQFCAWTTHRKS